MKLVYKVYSDDMDIRQQTTTINLDGISPPNTYNHVNEVLFERFKDYYIKINHVGRTVKLSYKSGINPA